MRTAPVPHGPTNTSTTPSGVADATAGDDERSADVASLSDRQLIVLVRTGTAAGHAARDELAERYRPLVLARAARLHRDRGPGHDDVVSSGHVGLLKAIRDFDPDRGAPFAAYADSKVVGEMMRWFRDSRYVARVPRPTHERAMAVAAAARRLEADGDAAPSDERLAHRVGLTSEQVAEARVVRAAERGRGRQLDPGRLQQLDTTAPDHEAVIALQSALRRLDADDRRLLLDRYWHEVPQRVVGDRLGVSQAHVSRLERRAIERLRALLVTGEEP